MTQPQPGFSWPRVENGVLANDADETSTTVPRDPVHADTAVSRRWWTLTVSPMGSALTVSHHEITYPYALTRCLRRIPYQAIPDFETGTSRSRDPLPFPLCSACCYANRKYVRVGFTNPCCRCAACLSVVSSESPTPQRRRCNSCLA